jgi:hypothetical protein
MKTVSVCRADTGHFTGTMFHLPDHALAQNTPEGCKLIEGRFDHLSQCVDVAALAQIESLRAELSQPPQGDIATEWRAQRESDLAALHSRLVIDYRPEKPSDEHEWNDSTKRWQLSQAAQTRDANRSSAQAQIVSLELRQARCLRELAIDPSNADARKRVVDIDRQIAEIRPALS